MDIRLERSAGSVLIEASSVTFTVLFKFIADRKSELLASNTP